MGQKLGKPDVPEKFLTPQGALALEPADVRKLRKLVVKGKLAPFCPGAEDSVHDCEFDECPICFLYHKWMNRSRCCGQRICSECFVQIKTASGAFLGSVCPFCKASDFNVEACGPKSEQEKQQERIDEQRILEHRIKEREVSIAHNGRDSSPQGNQMAVGMPATQDEMAGGEMPNSGAEIMNETRTEWEENPPTTDEPATGNIYSQPVHNRACSRPQPQEDEQERHQENQAQGLPTLDHNLSNRDMVNCAEYLGVFPEDLGLRLDEFNELLLEQTLISSMMENTRSRQSTQLQEPSEPVPNRETFAVESGELGSWRSDSTDPNWEFISLPRASTANLSGWDDQSRLGSFSGPSGDMEPPPVEQELESEAIVASSSTSDLRGQASLDAVPRISNHILNLSQGRNGRGVSRRRILRQLSLPSRLGGSERGSGAGAHTVNPEAPVNREPGGDSASSGVQEEAQHVSQGGFFTRRGALAPAPTRASSYPPRSRSDGGNGRGEGESGSVWRSIIAALALSGDVKSDIQNIHVGMVFIRHESSDLGREEDGGLDPEAMADRQPQEPEIDDVMEESDSDLSDLGSEPEEAAVIGSERMADASSREESLENSSDSDASEVALTGVTCQSLEINQISVNRREHTASKTIAVQNPDGSVVLVTVPDHEAPADPPGEGSSGKDDALVDATDAAIQRAIAKGDEQVVVASGRTDEAIVSASRSADEEWVDRMREMDERLKRALQSGAEGSSNPST